MLAAVAAHSRLGKAKVGFQPNRSWPMRPSAFQQPPIAALVLIPCAWTEPYGIVRVHYLLHELILSEFSLAVPAS